MFNTRIILLLNSKFVNKNTAPSLLSNAVFESLIDFYRRNRIKETYVFIKTYPLGAYIIMITPINAMPPPIRSNLSGDILSTFQPHNIERAINIPP